MSVFKPLISNPVLQLCSNTGKYNSPMLLIQEMVLMIYTGNLILVNLSSSSICLGSIRLCMNRKPLPSLIIQFSIHVCTQICSRKQACFSQSTLSSFSSQSDTTTAPTIAGPHAQARSISLPSLLSWNQILWEKQQLWAFRQARKGRCSLNSRSLLLPRESICSLSWCSLWLWAHIS